MGLLRTLFSLVVLALVAYAVFVVPIGSAPLSSHFADIWRSDLVQQKVAEVKADVSDKIEQRLAEAQTQAQAKAPGKPKSVVTDKERQELTTLIEKLQK